MSEVNEFFHDSYQSPSAQPGAYDEPPRRWKFIREPGKCEVCQRTADGLTVYRRKIRSYVHAQKPNGQPDVCVV